MADKPQRSTFDAKEVRRLAAVKGPKRQVEIEFMSADEKKLVVVLPVEAALKLGRLICDLSEGTPFLKDD